ncbi:unnamed protein product [Trifolium pratense]|uniref:Uncharacterized protein n=1 Tax=Trifolium pratense TaxID=57577 RepID=A0ACB0LCS5_TRIPR|nr:unnamed protein product [Trifolium pratense]
MEVLSSFYPDVSTSCNLIPGIFRCKSFVHIHSDGRGKLDPRALKCLYRVFFHPNRLQFTNVIIHSLINKTVTFHEQESYFAQTHLQGESTSKEDESLILTDLNLGPEVEAETRSDTVETEIVPKNVEIDPKNVETRGDNVETEIDSEKDENVGVDVRYEKNLVYTRKKNTIPESTHIHESDPTLYEVTFLDPSKSSDSVSEFSRGQEPEPNSIKHKKTKIKRSNTNTL